MALAVAPLLFFAKMRVWRGSAPLLLFALVPLHGTYLDRQYTVAAYMCSEGLNQTGFAALYPASVEPCEKQHLSGCIERAVCYLRERYYRGKGEEESIFFVAAIIVLVVCCGCGARRPGAGLL